jgi:DNA-binding transcriptional LysR family regulator
MRSERRHDGELQTEGFRVVANTLNFRRAADELHLTQLAITSQVKSSRWKRAWALRSHRTRYQAHTAGTTLLQYVRQIEAITNDAIAALALFGGQEGIELSIGASHTIAVYLLPRLLSHLLAEWPKLRIHILDGSTNAILHALTMHQIDRGSRVPSGFEIESILFCVNVHTILRLRILPAPSTFI